MMLLLKFLTNACHGRVGSNKLSGAGRRKIPYLIFSEQFLTTVMSVKTLLKIWCRRSVGGTLFDKTTGLQV